MIYFLTRLLLAIFGALATAGLYGLIVVPSMLSTVFTVVPFLLLSIIAFIYLQQTGSQRAASVAYVVGLIPFLMWIGAILLIFREIPGPNDELAGILLASYLAAAIGGYLCLIWSSREVAKKSSDSSH